MIEPEIRTALDQTIIAMNATIQKQGELMAANLEFVTQLSALLALQSEAKGEMNEEEVDFLSKANTMFSAYNSSVSRLCMNSPSPGLKPSPN